MLPLRQWLVKALCGTALAVMGPIGCGNVQETYPDFPEWGWWDRPADSDDSDVAAQNPPALPAKDDKPAATEAPSTAQPAARQARTSPVQDSTPHQPPANDLENHRQAVWQEAAVLRDLDGLSTTQKAKILASAKARLPEWYAPMPVAMPDPAGKHWTTTVVWDFMPEEEFQAAASACRNIARNQNQPFPDPPTRRGVMRFVQTMTSEGTDHE